MTARLITAVVAAVTLTWSTDAVTADEAIPECPPDLDLAEPIGPCGRDGNGPPAGPELVEPPADLELIPEITVPPAPAPTVVVAAPRYTG